MKMFRRILATLLVCSMIAVPAISASAVQTNYRSFSNKLLPLNRSETNLVSSVTKTQSVSYAYLNVNLESVHGRLVIMRNGTPVASWSSSQTLLNKNSDTYVAVVDPDGQAGRVGYYATFYAKNVYSGSDRTVSGYAYMN